MVDGDGSDDDGETERYEEVSQALPGLAVYGKSLLYHVDIHIKGCDSTLLNFL